MLVFIHNIDEICFRPADQLIVVVVKVELVVVEVTVC